MIAPNGVRLAGFITNGQPIAMAGAILCAARLSGKLFTLQSEYLYLSQDGELEDFGAAIKAPLVRRQDGFYVQANYRMNRWRIGGRYDRLALFSDAFKLAGTEQDLGSTPWRATGSLEFIPSEFSRIRLQYTHDRSARDGRKNNEVIAQFIVGIGAHAGHAF